MVDGSAKQIECRASMLHGIAERRRLGRPGGDWLISTDYGVTTSHNFS
jgi:hypothetical protein